MSRLSEKLDAKKKRELPVIAYARRTYADPSDNDLEIDDAPALSIGDDGTWVAAWVWVPNSEVEIP